MKIPKSKTHVQPKTILQFAEEDSVLVVEIMEGLESIDHVAYVRFASVYKNFHEAADFEKFVGKLEGKEE